MGSVYLKKYKDKNGNTVTGSIWWIKYYRNGKPFRESSGSSRKRDAEKKLKAREGEIVEGRFHGLRVERITLEELLADVLNDYRVNEKKSIARADLSVSKIKEYFEDAKTTDISTDRVRKYILWRKDQGVENATVNRDLAVLKRAFNLGAQDTPPKVTSIPHIPMCEESPARSGFFSHEEYLALKDALPSYLKPVIVLAYYTGMSIGEIRALKWNQVDLKEGMLSLRAEDTKTSEARIIFLEGESLEAVRLQKAIRDADYPDCPWVFFERGIQIGRFDKAWKTACKKAWEKSEGKIALWDNEKKVHTRVFHDFRRAGVRNLVRSGVPEGVAMKISGHKTRSVFERYNIVDEHDLKVAAIKLAEHHKQNAQCVQKPDGHHLGTISEKEGSTTDAREKEKARNSLNYGL